MPPSVFFLHMAVSVVMRLVNLPLMPIQCHWRDGSWVDNFIASRLTVNSETTLRLGHLMGVKMKQRLVYRGTPMVITQVKTSQ